MSRPHIVPGAVGNYPEKLVIGDAVDERLATLERLEGEVVFSRDAWLNVNASGDEVEGYGSGLPLGYVTASDIRDRDRAERGSVEIKSWPIPAFASAVSGLVFVVLMALYRNVGVTSSPWFVTIGLVASAGIGFVAFCLAMCWKDDNRIITLPFGRRQLPPLWDRQSDVRVTLRNVEKALEDLPEGALREGMLVRQRELKTTLGLIEDKIRWEKLQALDRKAAELVQRER